MSFKTSIPLTSSCNAPSALDSVAGSDASTVDVANVVRAGGRRDEGPAIGASLSSVRIFVALDKLKRPLGMKEIADAMVEENYAPVTRLSH